MLLILVLAAVAVLCAVCFVGSLVNTAVQRRQTASESQQQSAAAPTNPPPAATPTPAATLTPEEKIQAALARALGHGNRDVPRLGRVSLTLDVIDVQWAINDNLTENMIKTGARIDIADMLQAIDETGVSYELINFEGTFSMVDRLGNAREETVVWATYERATVDQINWDGFLTDNVYNVAASSKRHPAFQD